MGTHTTSDLAAALRTAYEIDAISRDDLRALLEILGHARIAMALHRRDRRDEHAAQIVDAAFVALSAECPQEVTR